MKPRHEPFTAHDNNAPTEIQQIYGSSLPPSLRWGGVRQQSSKSSDPPGIPESHSTRHSSKTLPEHQPLASSHRRGSFVRDGNEKWLLEEPRSSHLEHRHIARRHSPHRKLLLDRPHYQAYPGSSSTWNPVLDDRSKPASKRLASRLEPMAVVSHWKNLKPRSEDEKTRAAAEAFMKRTAVGKRRRHQATVEDAAEALVEQVAGAARDEAADFEKPVPGEDESAPEIPVSEMPATHGGDDDAESRFQQEMRSRLRYLGYTDKTIDIMVSKEEARKFKEKVEGKAAAEIPVSETPATHGSDDDFEGRLQQAMRRRLRSLGYTEKTIDIMVSEEEAQKFKKKIESSQDENFQKDPPRRRPVYPRINRKYLAEETLKYYDLPWEYDQSNPEYIIILRDMDRTETDVLFEHTARLRERSPKSSRASSKPAPQRMARSTDSDEEILSTSDFRQTVRTTRYDEVTPILVLRRNSNNPARWKLDYIELHEREEPDQSPHWFKRRPSDPAIYSQDLKEVPAIPPPSKFPALVFDDPHLALKVEGPLSNNRPSQKTRISRKNTLLIAADTKPALARVVHSTYGNMLGDAAPERQSSAGLITVSRDCDSYGDAMYYKIHFQQKVLDFEKFKEAVLELPELRRIREAMHLHFNRVQKLHEKTIQSGSPFRCMDAFCEPAAGDDHKIVVACIPYLQRGISSSQSGPGQNSDLLIRLLPTRFRAQASSQPPGDLAVTAHPVQTLFQTLNPRSHWRRDLKQAILHMSDTNDRRYLCLSQVWIVIVNEELIVTCSTTSNIDLFGGLLQEPSQASKAPTRGAFNLRLNTPDGKQWLFKHEDCPTYRDFTAHFSQVSTNVCGDFAIVLDGEEILPHQWPEMVDRAKRSTLQLDLIMRENLNHKSPMFPLSRPDPLPSAALNLHERLAFKQFNWDWSNPDGGDGSSSESGTKVSQANTPLDEGERDGSHTAEGANEETQSSTSSDTYDVILSKLLISADLLQSLNIKFDESEEHLTLHARPRELDELEKHIVFENARMREISRQHLALDSEAFASFADALPDTEQGSSRMPWQDFLSQSSEGTTLRLLQEDDLYARCLPISGEAYSRALHTWAEAREPVREPEDSASTTFKLSIGEVNAFCEALGHRPYYKDHVDEEIALSPDGWLYARFLNGLRGILCAFISPAEDAKTGRHDGKYLTAVLTLVDSFHSTLDPHPGNSAVFALRKMGDVFARLFNVVNELDLYSTTLRDLEQDDESTRKELTGAKKHIVIALTLSAAIIQKVDNSVAELESGIATRQSALIESGDHDETQSGYGVVRKLADTIVATYSEATQGPRATNEDQAQPSDDEFAVSVDQLEAFGWDRKYAALILWNEVEWERVRSHADRAWQIIRRVFRGLLQADPTVDIRWKAAAFPTDVMLLLLPQILWAPVLGEHDALDMYMQYITDLESNILTGDSSLEPLDRIRCLRHELNAFAQLQTEQIQLLSQISNCFSRLENGSGKDNSASSSMFSDPHPRRPILLALQKGLQIQNEVVQTLHSSLDNLQTEAQAQVAGVQDWRDNAAVVFTIITVIFLPLSFVSSVFGMNTADIRNMATTQWVFWLSAAVFTLVVIVVTLYFVDVPPLWRWVERVKNEDPVPVPSTTPSAQRTRAMLLATLARQDVEQSSQHERGRDATYRVVDRDDDIVEVERVHVEQGNSADR